MALSPILSTMDVEASIEFYTRKIGFEHAWSMPPGPDDKTTFACVKLGDAELLLGTIDFVPPEDRHKLGIGIQIYVEVPRGMDINALYVQASSSGATITRAIEDREWGERAFSFKDPDGYHFMMAQRR
jgi:uncharacterized glyoxalase superfamily protein PhnB